MVADNRIWFGKTGGNVPAIKGFLSEIKSGVTPLTIWLYNEVGHNQTAKQELKSIFPNRSEIFDTPKPNSFLQRIFNIATNPGDLILDSFAGSGTTGHAVFDLNNQDGGNRKFILVEMDKDISQNVTAERLKRVIKGYDKGGDEAKPVDGLGGGFRYCRLGVPLFNEFGDIDGTVNFPDLAAHIFFAESGVPIPQKANGNSPLIGQYRDKALYLLFSPSEPGFAREASGNVLTPAMLDELLEPVDGFEGQKIVFGEGCTVSKERLKTENIVFKQIPYQVEGN